MNEAFIEFVATLMIDPLDADAHAGSVEFIWMPAGMPMPQKR